MSLTRRAVLGGLAAGVPAATAAARLETSFRPIPRPGEAISATTQPVDTGISEIFNRSGLGDLSSFVLRDLQTGRVLEEHRPEAAMPPASVTKAVTSLYALEALGASHSFSTWVMTTGPISGGRVQGDLYLVGGGDPHLDTDGLDDLARQVTEAGIFGVNGNCYVVSGALPHHDSIDPEQPEHVGYNPSISGLNLNFNRVHFEWKPVKDGWDLRMSARSQNHDPKVSYTEMAVANDQPRVFAYRKARDAELWSVASSALGKGGARWLPVRRPERYAAEVFRTLAAARNLRLPTLRITQTLPKGARPIAEVRSAKLAPMLRSMLRYSTNLTAEVVGLRASQSRGSTPADIAASAAAMTTWLRGTHRLSRARFLNHSGLTDDTRISSAEMVQVLDIEAGGPLHDLMRGKQVVDEQGKPVHGGQVMLHAKSGTLNFTRGLAGYIDCKSGRQLAFSIFAADLGKRNASIAAREERPRGARRWRNVARTQEHALLQRWGKLYGAT